MFENCTIYDRVYYAIQWQKQVFPSMYVVFSRGMTSDSKKYYKRVH